MAQDVTIEVETFPVDVIITDPTKATVDIALPSPADSLQVPLSHPDIEIGAQTNIVIVQLGLL